MATDIDKLQVEINVQSAQANSAIDRFVRQLDKLTNSLSRVDGTKASNSTKSITSGIKKSSSAATKANKSFKGLASTFGRFYANCFLVIRGVKALWKSINSTADYLEAFNYFEVALNKIGGDWAGDWEKYSEKLGVTSAEEYASSFKTRLNDSLKGLSGIQLSVDADGKTGLLTDGGMKNLGLNIQEVTQYASQLASVTNSVGQTGETSLAAASAFTKLGADMSSLFNMDYSSVMNNLQSGLIGQSRALYKYGIDITNATLQTYAYESGVEKAVSEMTQAEKMQLRMIAILDQSRVSWGDQANTINSLSNSIRQFKNNISEAGQILGQLFIPIMSKIMPIINGVTIAIKRLMVSIAGLFGIKLDLSEFGQGTSGATDDMDGFSDSLDNATSSAEKLKKATTTLGIDELNINSPKEDTDSGSGSGVGGGIDLTDKILEATEEYEKAWKEAYDRMQNKAEEFANKITKFFNDIANSYKNSGLQGVGEFLSNGIANGLNNIPWDSIHEKASSFGSGLAEFLNGLISPELFGALGATIANHINTGIYAALAFGNEFEFEDLGESIASRFNNFFETFDSEAFAETINVWVQGAFDTIVEAISDMDWDTVWDSAKEFLENIDIKTVAIVLGALLIKKVSLVTFGASALSSIGTFVSRGIAQAIASKLGIEIAANAGIGAALKAGLTGAFTGIGTTFMAGLLGLFGNKAAVGALEFISPVTKAVTGIGSAIGGVTLAVSNFLSMWSGGFSWLKETLMVIGTVLAAVGAVILGAPALVAGVVAGIVAAVATIAVVVHDNWEKISSFFTETIPEFWNENIAPWFTKEKWEEILENVKESFGEKWDEIVEWWKTSAIYKWWNDHVAPWFTKKKWEELLGTIPTTFEGAFKSAANFAIDMLNKVIEGVETMVNQALEGLRALARLANKIPGVHIDVDAIQVEFPRIPNFETGGFPEKYSLFMAGENGVPELAGTVGGKTAVAGGAEITGISNAVYSTSEEELRELREMNSLLRQLLNKDTTVNIGDREIYKASVRGSKSFGRLLVT